MWYDLNFIEMKKHDISFSISYMFCKRWYYKDKTKVVKNTLKPFSLITYDKYNLLYDDAAFVVGWIPLIGILGMEF